MSSLYSINLDEFKKYLNKIFEHPANLKVGNGNADVLEFEIAIERLLLAKMADLRFL